MKPTSNYDPSITQGENRKVETDSAPVTSHDDLTTNSDVNNNDLTHTVPVVCSSDKHDSEKCKLVRRVATIATNIILSLAGTIILAADIPIFEWLSSTIPGGGDNPAHPVLMQSVGDAFFNHLSIVHYSFRFWMGFEAFQFYFPLPYLFGAFLSQIINSNIAFKITTILGILALPPAFFFMSRLMGLSLLCATISSFLAVSFLYTDAHVMWGGNVSSTLAGMIGNSWALVFLVLFLGVLEHQRRQKVFNPIIVILFSLVTTSHFYAFLMIGIYFGAILVEDLVLALSNRADNRRLFTTYGSALVCGLVMAWWILPLLYYKPFSADLGGDWQIEMLKTFRDPEKIFFATALVIGTCIVVWQLSTGTVVDRLIVRMVLFTGMSTALFYSNHLFVSTAFLNNRLWPTVYLGMYLILIVVLDRTLRYLPSSVSWGISWPISAPLSCAIVASFFFIIPKEATFVEMASWMKWNFSGLQTKPSANDFMQIVNHLSKQPSSRISFQSDGHNNERIGSVRTFEILPYLTQHKIIEGGIVNSALFAGIPYMLQCLTSHTCAGWPHGSIMPTKDIPRATEMMELLGVNYHISSEKSIAEELEVSGKFEVLHRGKELTLFKSRTPSSMVEVYDKPLPVVKDRPPYTSILNMPRWDELRKSAFVFDTPLRTAPSENALAIEPTTLFNFLTEEWRAGRRTADLGWGKIPEGDSEIRLNGYLFSWRQPFDLDRELSSGAQYFVADRGFDPHVYIYNMNEGYSEVYQPLVRDEEGVSEIIIHGRGYRAFHRGKELPFGKPAPLTFINHAIRGASAPFAEVQYIPIPGELYRSLDARTRDKAMRSGFPGNEHISIPQRITQQCKVNLTESFHELTLKTDCPGKPHLIKYSYFPKWRSDVPIYLGSQGYMVLTPIKTTTTLRHSWLWIDWCGVLLSLLGLAITIYWHGYERRRAVEGTS